MPGVPIGPGKPHPTKITDTDKPSATAHILFISFFSRSAAEQSNMLNQEKIKKTKAPWSANEFHRETQIVAPPRTWSKNRK